MSTNIKTTDYPLVYASEPHLRLNVVYNPFDLTDQKVSQLEYSQEKTLADYLVDLPNEVTWIVGYNGAAIEQDQWASIKPAPFSNISLVRVPEGGKSAKNVLRIAAIIAVAIYAPALAGAMLPGSVAGITVTAGMEAAIGMTVGGALVSAVLPPGAGRKAQKEESRTYGADGAKNTAKEGVPVPVVYGTHRFGGNIVDLFTRTIGNDVYTFLRTTLNQGEIADVTDIRINDQPIDFYNDKEAGSVEYRVRKGLVTGEPNDWFDESIRMIPRSNKLGMSWTTLRTTGEIDKLRLDLLFPYGLYFQKDDKKIEQHVTFAVQIRRVDSHGVALTDWTTMPLDGAFGYSGFYVQDTTSQPKRVTFQTPALTRGIYEVRINRDKESEEGTKSFTESYLNEIGEIELENTNLNGIANLSLKIKNSAALSGTPTVTALVKGSLVNTYDDDGNVVAFRWSDNPSHIATDILHNPLRGGGYDVSRQVWAAANDFAEFCELGDHKFNGVFDTVSSIWDAAQDVARVGRGTLLPRGVQLALTYDGPAEPQMIFGPGNIFKDSFKKSWVGLSQRANEIQLQFADADDDYKQKTIRLTDNEAIARGDRTKPATVNGFGITNIDQATAAAEFQARLNSYIKQAIELDAPLEAIGLQVGQVALIDHDSINFSDGCAGRLKAGSTVSTVKLDRPAPMSAGNTYALLVMHSAIKRATVAVTNKAGDKIAVTGIPGGTLPRMKRFIQGSHDIEIQRVSIGSGGVVYLTLDDATDIVLGQGEVWDTDVIEERNVVFNEGEHDTLTVTSPFLMAPAQYSNFMFGVKSTVRQPFRLKSIKGNGLDRRSLSFVQYDERVYMPGSWGSVVIDKPGANQVEQVKSLLATYDRDPLPTQDRIPVTLTWQAAKPLNYGGADIYVSRQTGIWEYLRTVIDVTTYQRDFSRDEHIMFRVVGFDKKGTRASVVDAPTVEVTLGGLDSPIPAPTDFATNGVSWLGTAALSLVWAYDVPGAQFRLQALQIDQGLFDTASQPLIDFAASWEAWSQIEDNQDPEPKIEDFAPPGLLEGYEGGVVVKETTGTLTGLRKGFYAVRVRAEKGFSNSPWTYLVTEVSAAEIPFSISGLRLNGGTADVVSAPFDTSDATFTWDDVISQAASGSSPDLAYNLLDYQVRILTTGNTVIRTEFTRSPSFSYSIAKNASDAAKDGLKPRRQFKIEIIIRGIAGQISLPRTMIATNAAPQTPTGYSAVATLNSLDIRWDACVETDYVATHVWMGDAANFPINDAHRVYKGSGDRVTISVESAGDKFFRIGHADSFGDPGNLTPSQTVFAPYIAIDTLKDISEIGGQIGDLLDGVRDDLEASALAGLQMLTKSAADFEDAVSKHRQQGVVIKSVEEQTEDSATKLEIIGVFDRDNQSVVIDQTKVKLTPTESFAERFSGINSKFDDTEALITDTASTLSGATEALATRVNTLGVLSPDGNSFIIDGAKAKISATESLAQRFSTISSTFESQSSTISQTAQTAANATSALTQVVNKIGALTPDGTAFIISDATARVNKVGGGTEAISSALSGIRSDVGLASSSISTLSTTLSSNVLSTTNPTSLASRVSSVEASAGGQTGRITTLESLVYTGGTNSLIARYGVSLNVNGHVTGFVQNNNGTTGDFTIVADRFAIVDPSAPSSRQAPFVYAGGLVRMTAVEVDTFKASSIVTDSLQDNSVTVPSTLTAADTLYGFGGTQTVLSFGVYLNKAGMITAQGAVSQHFPNGIDKAWDLRLYIDDTQVYRAYGARAQDSVPLLGGKYCQAGYRNVYITWTAGSDVNIDYRTLTAVGIMK